MIIAIIYMAVFRAFVLGIYIWMGIDSGCDHQNHIFQPITWMLLL